MKLQFLSFGESELIDQNLLNGKPEMLELSFQGAGKKFIIQLH